MADRRWDHPWQEFPASKPLPVEGGMTTRKQRGDMADTWWSKRFVTVLESYGLGARMQRGRRYARAGQVVTIDVTPGLMVAQVQGSRRVPYVVTAQAPQPSSQQWAVIDDALRSRVGFAARLLDGEVPAELEEVFAAAGARLFPSTWSDFRATCNCPDWENPCKHIAATLYLYADQLDADPWLLLLWRGRTRDDVLGHLGSVVAAGAADNVAPWWPLVPGGTRLDDTRTVVPAAEPPSPPHRVLQQMEPLAADVAGTALTDLLAPVYDDIIG